MVEKCSIRPQIEEFKNFDCLNESQKNEIYKVSLISYLTYVPEINEGMLLSTAKKISGKNNSYRNNIKRFINYFGDAQLLKSFDDNKTGLGYKLYELKRNNELVLSFKGVEFGKEGINDEIDAIAMFGRSKAQVLQLDQIKQALNEYRGIKGAYPGKKITVVGYSMGGAIAQSIGYSNRDQIIYSINSIGMKKLFEGAAPSNIINIVADVLSDTSYSKQVQGSFFIPYDRQKGLIGTHSTDYFLSLLRQQGVGVIFLDNL